MGGGTFNFHFIPFYIIFVFRNMNVCYNEKLVNKYFLISCPRKCPHQNVLLSSPIDQDEDEEKE